MALMKGRMKAEFLKEARSENEEKKDKDEDQDKENTNQE